MPFTSRPAGAVSAAADRASVHGQARARRSQWLLTAASAALALSGLAAAAPARAQDGDASKDTVVQEVVVTGARNLTGVIQKRDSSVALGIDKPLVDTPRSVTAISDQLLDRYNIKTVYDFTAVAAGTYTGSYFGVPGSLNIRGLQFLLCSQGFDLRCRGRDTGGELIDGCAIVIIDDLGYRLTLMDTLVILDGHAAHIP